MILTEEENQFLKEINASPTGRILVSLLERSIREDLFSPESLTAENVEAKKEAAKILRRIIDGIKLANLPKDANNNQYT